MAKIIFVEDGEPQSQKPIEINAGDAAELFRLAERLSEAELERMKRAIQKLDPK